MSIAKQGFPFILALAVPTVICFAAGFPWPGGALLFLTLFVVFFFRDPTRNYQPTPGQVVSPADGKVVWIRRGEEGQEVISIFLSVFNVHVNRSPIGGKIAKIDYRPGKFLIAYDERASTENEQNSISIDTGSHVVRFVQIAGLVARRIVCWVKEGETLTPGERIGLIRFGSRVDVFLPPGSKVQVQMNQKVKAGTSVIGELP